jgi:ribulose-phosphate 3-epimerase
LASELRRIDDHADILHVDVSDGHFVPQMLFFPDLTAVVRKHSRIPIHVHLMVTDEILLSQIEQCADAGADLISIHVETSREIADRALNKINRLGLAAGLVLTLESEVEAAAPYLDGIQFLTMVATQIGIKGIGPDERAYERLKRQNG